ncbi:MAG: FkbM family methyltransferase [Pyrinomonadaceae bacterium]|nr:FkbM family methyltransferase [Sphingobacteriaceae bacterium]
MNALLFITKVYNKFLGINLKLSFSQCGEDSIIMFLITSLGLKKIQYFDIGTNNPRNMNNTYLMYLNGYKGVCVEPDPFFHNQIKKYRPKDTLIPAGISSENSESAKFYIMDDSVLNTFSKSEAENMVNFHQRKIKKTICVPLISINEILETYHLKDHHTIVSIDVEGLDFIILKSLNFSKYRPSIICVETLEYSKDLTGKKNEDIISLLSSHNYSLYADTHINSIFVNMSIISNK